MSSQRDARELVYAGSAMAAEIVREMLEAAGLEVWLRDAWLGAIAPFYTSGGGAEAVKVEVPRDQAERARELIAAWERPTREKAWQCPACGAVVEGQFAACWRCGAERPRDYPRNASGGEPQDAI